MIHLFNLYPNFNCVYFYSIKFTFYKDVESHHKPSQRTVGFPLKTLVFKTTKIDYRVIVIVTFVGFLRRRGTWDFARIILNFLPLLDLSRSSSHVSCLSYNIYLLELTRISSGIIGFCIKTYKQYPIIICYMGAYLGKGTYWQLITSCWLYFGVLLQI